MAEGVWDGNVDSLFSALNSFLKTGEYNSWQERLKEVFSTQLNRYEEISGTLCRALRGDNFHEFKPMEHLYLRGGLAHNLNTSSSIDMIVVNITPSISKQGITFLEQDIARHIENIKEVPSDLEDMRAELDRQSDVAEMICSYFLKPTMKAYEEGVRDYLGKVDSLNEVAEQTLLFSQKRLSWAAGKSMLVGKMLSRLRQKYDDVGDGYKALFDLCQREYDRGYVSIPHQIEKLSVDDREPLFVEFMRELREYDPEPGEIKVDFKGNGGYILSIKSSNTYDLVKPSLNLEIGYADEFDSDNEDTIDLTKERDGVIFRNNVSKQDDKVLEVELQVKPPDDGSFRITSLEVTGSYELIYLKERKTLATVELAKPSVKLL